MSRNQTEAAPQGARKSAGKGTAGHTPLCPGQRASPPAPDAPLAAPSLAALTLTPRKGVDVHCTITGDEKPETVNKLLTDLTTAYLAAEREWNDITDVPETFKGHKTMGRALAAVTSRFETRFCPDGAYYLIEEDKENYSFIICKECRWPGKWNTLEVKKILQAANACSPALVEVAILFLKLLIQSTKIQTWYNGAFEMAEDWVEEQLMYSCQGHRMQMDDETLDGDLELKTLKADLDDYRRGEAAHAAARIQEANVLSPDEILARIKRIRKDHPLKAALAQGCEFLKRPYDLHCFDNPEYQFVDPDVWESGFEGVYFFEQNTILWEYQNALTASLEDYMNSRFHNAGQADPLAIYEVSALRTDWGKERFDNSLSWPLDLFNLFSTIETACRDCDSKPVKGSRKQKNLLQILV